MKFCFKSLQSFSKKNLLLLKINKEKIFWTTSCPTFMSRTLKSLTVHHVSHLPWFRPQHRHPQHQNQLDLPLLPPPLSSSQPHQMLPSQHPCTCPRCLLLTAWHTLHHQ